MPARVSINTPVDRHVQRHVNVSVLEYLAKAILDLAAHEPRYLVLGQGQLLTTDLGKAHVLNFPLTPHT